MTTQTTTHIGLDLGSRAAHQLSRAAISAVLALHDALEGDDRRAVLAELGDQLLVTPVDGLEADEITERLVEVLEDGLLDHVSSWQLRTAAVVEAACEAVRSQRWTEQLAGLEG